MSDCNSNIMTFTTWKLAPMRARLFNGIYMLLAMLAWASCIVAFSAELFRCQQSDIDTPHTYHFYYDRIETVLGHLSFGDMNPILNEVNGCTAGGRLLVGFDAVAFIGLTLALVLAGARIAGLHAHQLPSPRQSLFFETILSVLATGSMFLALTTYGAKCYHDFQASPKFTEVRATGYAYVIVGFFMMLVGNALLTLVKRDPPCWLGADTSSSDSSIGYNDDLSLDAEKLQQAGDLDSDVRVVESNRAVSVKPVPIKLKKERAPEYSGYNSYYQSSTDT